MRESMKLGIGLCGAHRVGKTTLALAVSQAARIPFLKTQTSQLFANHGLDPAKPIPFQTRLSIQHEILTAGEEIWSQTHGRFITDRTPLDMAAYTLADIQGTTEVDSPALLRYLRDCIEKTNYFFSTLIIVPPGIPLVPEPGKAALHEAYIEHIHTLIVGFCYDQNLSARVSQLSRETLALDHRVKMTLAAIA